MLMQQVWTAYSGSGWFNFNYGSPRLAEKPMGKCVFKTTWCLYQIVPIVRRTCKLPWIWPNGCPDENDGPRQKHVIGDETHGPGHYLDACSRGWDWEGQSMILYW
jgi:hypothetical protein